MDGCIDRGMHRWIDSQSDTQIGTQRGMHTWSICIEGSAICGSTGACKVGRPIPFKRDTDVTGTVRVLHRDNYVTICGSAGARRAGRLTPCKRDTDNTGAM